MVKSKNLYFPLKIFHVHNELMSLDKEVNEFLRDKQNKRRSFLFLIVPPVSMVVLWALFVSLRMKGEISDFIFLNIITIKVTVCL